jgi:hypothetical protein
MTELAKWVRLGTVYFGSATENIFLKLLDSTMEKGLRSDAINRPIASVMATAF